MDYNEFINSKKHSNGKYGFKPLFIPDSLFDFQKYLLEWSVELGRAGCFVDTGLGKTRLQLSIAENIVRHTNKRVLILTPLAVAFQFILEAEQIGIESIEYSKNGKFTSKIVLANYERLHYFNPSDFDGLILDESSILKNFDGAIKNNITSFIKQIKYRFLSTATPSPNDFTELGTSSEALGYLGYMDMLTKFFRNNEDTINPLNIGTEWVLKSHAKDHFWQWVSSWSKSVRKPSDIGFSDDRFILPNLITNTNIVKNQSAFEVNGQLAMFNTQATRLTDVRKENKDTLEERCQKAVELANKYETSVYWCNLNNESDLIEKLDPNAKQIKGSMDIDKKEELLVAFSKGEIKKLITKPKITAFGLNWQHCNHTVYFPTFSYEQYYQSIRRFWRFGQKRDVIVDLVLSDGQDKVIQSLNKKSEKANEMFENLNRNINKKYDLVSKGFDKNIILPSFI